MITMKFHSKMNLPVIVEKDEVCYFIVECPFFKGCYTQGETLDVALKNIHEVIDMCLEDENEDTLLGIGIYPR